MIRSSILLAGAFLVAGAAQAQIIGISVPEFKTAGGTLVHIGDTLHLGRGTSPNGEFQYVYVPENMFTGGKQTNFNAQMGNLSVRVKDIRVQHSRSFGDKTVAVIKATTMNGCIDLNQAERSGEIITPNTPATAPVAGIASVGGTSSTADEIIKLRKLYDQKVLTKAEYDAQKAKLLR